VQDGGGEEEEKRDVQAVAAVPGVGDTDRGADEAAIGESIVCASVAGFLIGLLVGVMINCWRISEAEKYIYELERRCGANGYFMEYETVD
jgi:hypothetical protein